MTTSPPMHVKAMSVSRPIDAEEWAIRQGSALAKKHLPNAEWKDQTELAADIAEALTAIRRACHDGLM